MQPISSLAPVATQWTAEVRDVNNAQRPESEEQSRPSKPVTDQYIPEKKQEPFGRYWLGKDEDDNPKIYFDAPQDDRNVEDPDKNGSGGKTESCTCNTDKVDREIEKLKEKKEELEHQIHSETDPAKVKELEKKLAQAESELRQKDNDSYRRQHAAYTFS